EHFMSLNVPFNTGSTQRDFSGNSGTNGTVTNAIVQTSGCQVGACISFDGNGDYVTFPDTTVWDFNDELTFSVWHLAPQADIANQVVLAQGTSSTQYSFALELSGGSSDDRVIFSVQTDPSGTVSA